jgi:hypothetical protein
LIEVARSIGRGRPPGEEPVEFDLTPEELDACHADRLARLPRNATAGKADTVIILVRRKTDGRLEIDKLDFVRRLAASIAEEIVAADEAAFADIRRRRPIVGFVVDRVLGPLNRPRPLAQHLGAPTAAPRPSGVAYRRDIPACARSWRPWPPCPVRSGAGRKMHGAGGRRDVIGLVASIQECAERQIPLLAELMD